MLKDPQVIHKKVLSILSDLTGLPDLQNFLDLNLFDEGLLDSLTLVRLLVDLSKELGIEMTPADIVREQWSTARSILKSVEANLPA